MTSRNSGAVIETAAAIRTRVGAELGPVVVNRLDTGDVAPMANPHDATQRLREDQVTETDRRDEFQALAPAVEDGLYLVPRVID